MQDLFGKFFFMLLSIICINAYAAAEKYTFDPSHTYVNWKVNHFGFSHPSGKWLAEGDIYLDEANPQDSKIDVKIKLSDIVTGIPKFDKHLKSTDFFDVAKYPIATFKSTKVDVHGADSATVVGDLTLHGVTKPVTLQVKLNKADISPMTQTHTVGFTATTQILRSDFGLGKFAPGVSDEVEIMIEAEAGKAKPMTGNAVANNTH